MNETTKKPRKRKHITADLEDAIITIWSGYESKLRSMKHNKVILVTMCEDLKQEGHDVSVPVLKIKLQNLRRRYMIEKSLMSASGAAASEWQHYTRVREIIENNRVNRVTKKKPKKNFPIFIMESGLEAAIIDVWNNYERELRDMADNKCQLFTKMTEVLKLQGYEITIAALKSKIHDLRAKYEQEKQNIESSQGVASSWQFYSRVHEIIDRNVVIKSENIVEDNATMSVDELAASCSSSDQEFADSSTPTTKGKSKDNVISNEIIKLREELKQHEQEDRQYLRAMEEKFLEVEIRKANALTNISAAFKKITDKFFE